jgi:hypothetical protein
MRQFIGNQLILLLFPWLILAQTTPKYSNEFLNIGVNARALAMGNAQVAIVNDVTSGYWNPSGLLQIKDSYQIGLMHSEHFGGVAQYDYAGFATPVDSVSHIGITAIRFGVDDIPDTRFLYNANGAIDYNNIRFFNSADYAFLVSYARKTNLLGGLRLGANLKVIYRNVGNFANAFGFGLDFGAQWQVKKWHFGLMARDVTSTFNAWTHNTALIYDIYVQTGNQIPKNSIEITLPRLMLGLAREFQLSQKIGLLASIDWVGTFDGNRNALINLNGVSIEPNLGIELNYQKMIYIRTGLNNYQKIKNFDGSTFGRIQNNFGLGVQLKNFTIDYALTRNNTDTQNNALYSNIFSVKIAFGK